MKASVGDRIVVHGHHLGEPDRNCEVLEVHGEGGAPPYVVRWDDSGHGCLFFPGPDASVQHFVRTGHNPASDGLGPLATSEMPGSDQGRE